jgi:small GTP-binding protein
MKRIVAGIVAHVDAGKTTLSEAMLYRSGEIRTLGRVDHGDAFLDTDAVEKSRGITIFAHQALVEHGNLELTLLDTPGHVDFAAETERVLHVLDYAILVVSAMDGVQGHTETLWRLLARYGVPTFIFVNKCDATGVDCVAILDQLRTRLSDAVFALPATAPASSVPASSVPASSSSAPAAAVAASSATASISASVSAAASVSAPAAAVAPMPALAKPAGGNGRPIVGEVVPQPDDDGEVMPLGPCAEDIATLDEAAMDEYLETGVLSMGRLRSMIADRRLFPVFFGSALKLEGVEEFLDGLEAFTRESVWPGEFGARAFKISHDGQHNRLTWLRVTGGQLKAKEMVAAHAAAGEVAPFKSEPSKVEPSETAPSKAAAPEIAASESASSEIKPFKVKPRGSADCLWAQKVDQVRVYNGTKFETVTEVPAGAVCAVTGLEHTFPGEGLGAEGNAAPPALQPVLTYTVLPAGVGTSEDDPPRFDDLTLHKVLGALHELEDEDPLLRVIWVSRLGEIHVQLMGAVQLEIIQQTMRERFGLDVAFGPGSILYRETITKPIEGVGHFEPLRHYAEAHILLEPGEPGSGIRIRSALSENELGRNWQSLIMTHLGEKEHLGVLLGAPLTDIAMTLVAGKAHLKHTEGGDFRQATYRAVRQGLMEARAGVTGHPIAPAESRPDTAGLGNCRVLEPWYRFRLEVPADMVGRAMSDVQRMSGTFVSPLIDGGYATISGEAPVAEMRDYAMDVNQYTHGRGRFSATFGGYKPCHDETRVIAAAEYAAESDMENTPDSVFCAHGAGYPVAWYKVPEFMHLGYMAAASGTEGAAAI